MTTHVTRNSFEVEVANYYDTKQDDKVNLLPGKIDGLYHHHNGIGPINPDLLSTRSGLLDQAIIDDLHRLESQQVELIMKVLGGISTDDSVMDAGSGRGGTCFMLADRFGCQVEGIAISQYQVDFATRLAVERGCASSVRFSLRNMVDTKFPAASFQAITADETTMYVDLAEAFSEFARILKPGGRVAIITACYRDVGDTSRQYVDEIDRLYKCHIHPRSTYVKELVDHDLIPCQITDLSADAIPYWTLRERSSLRTGIETPILASLWSQTINYLLLVAERR
ncbi:methyltransferase domain-containing protein [Streptomyces sp. NPDC006863]|uniref:SAM-dependent methyltransferase n=1 Tax=unclassified Streptomyces TaxID=2593676 RepID=UPI0033ED0091